jgi:ATP-binding cassette subfamily F protein 3
MQVNYGDRTALVGPNGAGKSTLFSLILKEQEPDEGTVVFDSRSSLGYLPQESIIIGEETVIEIATAVTPEHAKWRRILVDCESKNDINSEKYHEAQDHCSSLGVHNLDPKAKKILKGLAFRETDFDRPARTLSGGWIMRAHLAKLLVMEPDLLLLDEPTNHLDLESLGWFQNYLKSYPGAILMISHDRAFLNALIDQICEIRGGKLHRYRGNYDDYVEQKKAREAQHLSAYKNQQKEIESLQNFADRFRAKASKASQAQSKLKQIERMEKIEAPDSTEKRVRIRFPQPKRGSQRAIALENIFHSYGDLKVYQGMNFEAEREQKIVLVGPNGAGKSTLLKILAGVLPVQQGVRMVGPNTKVGYFSQNRVETLKLNNTVLQEVMEIETKVPEQAARTVLGSFLFSGDDVFKKVSVLSGGEKTRLALVKSLLDPPNLLLMDEPTTHLDMTSIDALVEALEQYQGTLIFISHDVYFIRSLAKSVLHISAGQLMPYAGNYDYYLEKTKAVSERSGLVAGKLLTDSRPELDKKETVENVSIFKTKEQKRKEAEERQARSDARKKLQSKIQIIERDIAQCEQQQKEMAAKLEDSEIYQQGGEVMRVNQELMILGKTLEHLNQLWTDTSAQLTLLAPAESKKA